MGSPVVYVGIFLVLWDVILSIAILNLQRRERKRYMTVTEYEKMVKGGN